VIVLGEPIPGLTERFHEGLLAPHSLEGHPVLTRWARVARLGLPADADGYPRESEGPDLTSRRGRLENVLREETALVDQLADELTAHDVMALLADPDGVILASRGGGAVRNSAARLHVVEGASWGEAARGTNAIGTAIVEGKPVAVVGRAHYELRNTGLFCYATPIRDAFGDLVAVLDVTGVMERHDPSISLAVQAAGSAIERTLRAQAFTRTSAGSLSVLERLMARCRSPALLVEASGAVRIGNDAADALLHAGLDRGAGAPRVAAPSASFTCERIFGVSFRQLAAIAAAGSRTPRFETRGASFAVDLDPLVAPDGRTLAFVVYLERIAPRGRPLEPPRVRAGASEHPAFAAIRGSDPALCQAKALAQRFAGTALPVLLLAETGTGKELFARAIHGASARGRGPFVALNCGAISASLLESELFGHAPGAFTGAAPSGSEGKIGAANGGTLFLDEVAEMPDALQATLLRVLDDGTYYRVGDGRPRRSDFRLVCATSRDLPAMVERGAFRRDLFFRVHGACVTIPPLRGRNDRLPLAMALLAELQSAAGQTGDAATLTEDASRWIERHTWPGNVRELKSALLHALALADGGPIGREHFPEPLVWGTYGNDGASRSRAPGERTRHEVLRDEYAATVRACSGNVAEAARRLGVARSTIYRTLKG
jgi:transcriptional regulator of acetoin/glycerol metabolism